MLLGSSLLGQSKHYLKAKSCFEDGKYSKALKKIEKAKTDKAVLDKEKVYLLESKTYLALNEIEPDLDYTKKAVKAAIRAKDKSDNPQGWVVQNKELYRKISDINQQEALSYYNQERYSKAITYFKRSMELNKDSYVSYLLGKSYILYNDFSRGMPILDELLNEQFQGYQKSHKSPSFLSDAFNIYTDALITKNYEDSAEVFLDMGLEMFPTDRGLLIKQKELWVKLVGKIPLSLSLFKFLDNATELYPYDSFFTFKKNGAYLMFISNQLEEKNKDKIDWLSKFIQEKVSLASANQRAIHKEWDYFLEKDSLFLLEKIAFYFGNFENETAQKEVFKRYAKSKYNGNYLEAMENLQALFPAFQVADLYQSLLAERYSRELINQRLVWYKGLLDKDEKVAEDFEALLRVNTSLGKAYKSDRINIVFDYWNNSLDIKDFWKCYELGKIAERLNSKRAKDLWVKTITEDYKKNYFGTRVLPNVPGDTPYGYTWNGDVSSCYPGFLPDSILRKVAQRINYFRRTAGIEEPIALSKSYNSACQEAVLFYTANKNLTHELNYNLYCYSDAAAQAGEKSLLSAGVHTTIAITSFMADNSASLGNRRWMLYPPTKYMGFGSSQDRNALWCVVNNNTWDSSAYTQHGIAWPPQGYSPAIFQFKYWSFSAYRDFKDAKVVMINSATNEKVKCEIQPLENGYGMPTLVWSPEIKRITKESQRFLIEILFKDGKKISYEVNLEPTPDL